VESFVMFTPQKNVWPGWSLTPRSGAQKTGVGSGRNPGSGADGKGKSVVATPNSGLGAVGTMSWWRRAGTRNLWPRIFRGFKTRFVGYIWCIVLEFL